MLNSIQIRELKWQKLWEEHKVFRTESTSTKKKCYILDMFPYPSGEGLHVGHVEGYTATDIYARYKRKKGFNVLHPMGFDSFGLPAENYALKTGIHPAIITERNINNFRKQLKQLGLSYDWDREIRTSDPSYYKWTQWLFLKLYEENLAYEAEMMVNWCPQLKTVLANEEVVDGKSEIGGYDVIQRPMKQWILKITDYAEELINDLEDLDWPDSVKEMQRKWIGKSEGAEIFFQFKDKKFSVFTTRPETIFGVSAIVFSPEHPLVNEISTDESVLKYQEATKRKSLIDRQSKKKTALFLKNFIQHPITQEEIPLYIADYVLPHYGTGIVMCVPSHDKRDFELAQEYSLKLKPVIQSTQECFEGDGEMIHSDFLNTLDSKQAKSKIIHYLEEKKLGKKTITYKLRDWIFSRQRYWGEPFPLLKKDGKTIPLSYEELPLILPDIEKIEPSETGESPLAKITSWIETPQGIRESHTMPQWAGSCWYYLRFIDPLNTEEPFSKQLENYWLPVDLYIGGMEHAVLHLLYARFWHKVFFKIGLVSTKEPFQKLFNQGLILGPDGEKMSKSRGNVISPNDIIATYGADTLRMFEMFLGPLEKSKPWNSDSIKGIFSFLQRVEKFQPTKNTNNSLTTLHFTIKKVEDDFLQLKFNTAISQLMICLNVAEKEGLSQESFLLFLNILNPLAPHLTEELWEKFGQEKFLSLEEYPSYNKAYLESDEVTIIVQISGKTKLILTIAKDSTQEEVRKQIFEQKKIQRALENIVIVKEIFVINKIYNFII